MNGAVQLALHGYGGASPAIENTRSDPDEAGTNKAGAKQATANRGDTGEGGASKGDTNETKADAAGTTEPGINQAGADGAHAIETKVEPSDVDEAGAGKAGVNHIHANEAGLDEAGGDEADIVEAKADVNERHRLKAARIKAAKDRLYATKTIKKGLLIVHTGAGKGKSTAAWGLAMRCLGHGLKLGVVQFIKGRTETGERRFLARFPELATIEVMGQGFTWETQDRARDVAAAEAAFARAEAMLADPALALVILDELNIVLRYEYLPLERVLEALRGRRPDLHVVVTGRNAKPELLAAADLVTEMKLVKHPFREGVMGQLGIEF